MVKAKFLATATLALCNVCSAVPAADAGPPHNVVLFVADGLRHGIVTQESAPTLWRVMREGVAFADSHSIFPTFTTANASAMATGHYLGDTGDFSNTIYTGEKPLPAANGSVTPFLESDQVLGDADERFDGNYLDEDTVLALARAQGYATAAIGKLGPTLIMDHTDRGQASIVIDDLTGDPRGVALPAAVQEALDAAKLGGKAPSRGANGNAGDFSKPGTLAPNVHQQAWLVSAATNVVLPWFKTQGKPFLLVFWSRDPDGTQHNQGDSFLQLAPGINGPTSLAAIRNVDNNLSTLLSALKSQGLAGNTDVIVTSDHGFSTISKRSESSPSAKAAYPDVPPHLLPPGFLALDLSTALGLPLFNPDKSNAPVPAGAHTSGNGLIGADPAKPDVVVAANGGSDLVYLPGDSRAAIAPKVVEALLAQDYVSGLFVDDRLGAFPGTLPMSAINLIGKAVTPVPAIVVNFRSFHVDGGAACPTWLTCVAEVADSTLQQGQGMHGSFSRADTFNFTAAVGPSFKHGYVDRMPVSNADVGQTIAKLMRLPIDAGKKGTLQGRPLDEALAGGREAKVTRGAIASTPSSSGLRTFLHFEQVGDVRYFKAAGFAGRTAGIDAKGRPDHLDEVPKR